jgi:hypothetical protein
MEKEVRDSEIVKLYLTGVSMSEITKEYLLHRSTVQRILIKNGVKLHKNKSFIKCNKGFFSNYTKESCYWAGFILADGNLRVNRNSLQIKIGKKDKEHLYSFLKVIECDDLSLVKEYDNYVSVTISLDEFKNGLTNNFEITPRKTYTAIISDKIPNNLIKHFIRGYLDGDGCISMNKEIITLSFVGTNKILCFLRDYFKNEIGVKLKSKHDKPPIQERGENIGEIHYSGKNAIKILNVLYDEITENNYLNRKFLKYFNYEKR